MKLIEAALVYHPAALIAYDSNLVVPSEVCKLWDTLLHSDGSLALGWGIFSDDGALAGTYAGALVLDPSLKVGLCSFYVAQPDLGLEKPNGFWISRPTDEDSEALIARLISSSSFVKKVRGNEYIVWKLD